MNTHNAVKTGLSFPLGNVQVISIEYMIKSFNGEMQQHDHVACTALQREDISGFLHVKAPGVSPGLVREEMVTL